MLKYVFADEFNECLEQYKVFLPDIFFISYLPIPNPISQGGIPVGSLLGPPDPERTQIIQDPETGESKAKMTEVKVEFAQIC